MNDQALFWLYPISALSLFALIANLRLGLKWSWALCLQWLIILSVSLIGLFTGHKWPAVFFCWGAFVLVAVAPRIYLRQLERHLSILQADQAVNKAKMLRFIYWGQPGRFWLDMARTIAFFIHGDSASIAKGEAIIAAWQEKNLPREVRLTLATYAMNGNVLCQHWQEVIDEHVNLRKHMSESVPWSIANLACRAYAECSDFENAYDALRQSNLTSTRVGSGTLELLFLPLFALAGNEEYLAKLFDKLKEKGSILPPVSRHFWYARCMLAKGKAEEAKQALMAAKYCLPAGKSAWLARIESQIAQIDKGLTEPLSLDTKPVCDSAYKLYEKATLISEIILPGTAGNGVGFLMTIIIIVYVLSHSFSVLASGAAVNLAINIFRFGVLDPQLVFAGQYWRLVTYLFLHANLAHLMMNLFGLWWFGRWCEGLYGTRKFYFLFFSTGIISACVQIYFAPNVLAAGASGAIMGLFGAAAAAIFRLKKILPAKLRQKELIWMMSLVLLQVIFDQLIPKIAGYAHLGGVIGGFFLALFIPLSKDIQTRMPG